MGTSRQKKKPAVEPDAAWWTVGGPCAVVIAMILLGIGLRAPTGGAQTLDSEPERHREPIDLVSTATDGAQRLEQHRGSWTLQFMVGCERQSLEPIVESLDDQSSFFLLRSPDTGTDCYRVCWGWYASKAEAERPRHYPEVLSSIDTMGWARPVDEVLP